MRNVWVSTGCVLSFLSLAGFQRREPQSGPPHYTARDPQLKELQGLALACQPELAADAMLRLADLAPEEKSVWKEQLFETAFRLAEYAKVPYPSVPVPVGFTDTVPAMSAIASRLQLDRLSLQIRAIQSMLSLNPARAREMFESIPIPSPPSLTCNDFLVPQVSVYYECLRVLAERAFTPGEVRKGSQEDFLSRRVGSIVSPQQVFPVAALLSDTDISSASRGRLLNVFATAVRSTRGDDRSFTAALLHEGSVNELRTLVHESCRLEISPVPVLEAVRTFYANHLRGTRCSDTAQSQPLKTRQAEALEAFNKIALEYLPKEARLTMGESGSGAKYIKAPSPVDLWRKSGDYRSFSGRMANLTKTRATTETSGPNRAEVEQVLRALDYWTASDELAPEEFFIVKSVLLSHACGLAKEPSSYELASEAYVRFMDSAVHVRETRPELWLWSLLDMLKQAQGEGPSRKNALMSALEASKNPVSHLYAGLNRRASAIGRPRVSP